jgi:hypothetical protein
MNAKRIATAGLLVALCTAPEMAWSQTPTSSSLAATAPITYTGTVTAVDAGTRVVTTRDGNGVLATWEFPPSVPQSQVDGLRVGQTITVTYSDAIALRRKPAGEPTVDRVDRATRLRTATVTITAVDLASSTVTFTGASGRTFTRQVVDPANAALLRGVTIGERVDVSWYETMELRPEVAAVAPALAVAQPVPAPITAPVDDPDALRHRLTLSVLWGVDNQFSGKMIKAASGTTTGGAPIRLADTTYDEVYGRMALFKAGVGYRLSPRSEAVLNFVLSRSSAETVLVGTVGTGNVPLEVDFDNYNYWGVEGGQRFYFSQVRFTPYVGYLVGLNRFGDIRGTFVNVPPNLTPGLSAQDGKFFEKSWAFSASGTGGVLIGVGPFEVMGEVALRFMGGLSDVDWLVEEGLRDINKESSRWSVPLMVGARIRF